MKVISDLEGSSSAGPSNLAIQECMRFEPQDSAIPVKITAGGIDERRSFDAGTEEPATASSIRGSRNTATQNSIKCEIQDSTVPAEIIAGGIPDAQLPGIRFELPAIASVKERSPGFISGPAAFSSRVKRRKPTLKAEAPSFSPSAARAAPFDRASSISMNKVPVIPERQTRDEEIGLSDPTGLYSWVRPSAWAYPDSNKLYELVSLSFYAPFAHLSQPIETRHERSPSIESIQTPSVVAAKATSVLRATTGSFVLPVQAHLKNKNSTPSTLAANQANRRNQSLAVSLRPVSSAFIIPSQPYTTSRAREPYNPLAEPFTPSTVINRSTSHQSLRPFPAYFPLEFVNLLSQAGMYSVEDARQTLRNMDIVFKFVKGLAERAPDMLHCFVLEFSMVSKFCKLLDFPPFNSATTATRQPPLEMAELTSISMYCDSMSLEILQWAGLNFVQEAEELFNIPESVPIFVERLARIRPDAFTTFRDTFDLHTRLDEMLGYA